jgi:protein phosphatase
LKYGSATDKGLIRTNNEDCFAVVADADLLPCAFIIADGMGGRRMGELASSIAVEYVSRRLMEYLPGRTNPEEIATALHDIVEKANVKVYLGSLESEENKGMGTTLTIAVVLNGALVVANVGDSRAYLLRGASLMRITVDHTLVQELVDSGNISPEDARVHPKRHILTRALGIPEFMSAECFTVALSKGDRILLCTDGLHGAADEEDIRTVLRRERMPDAAARRLVELANRCGGEDNVTVITAFL